MSLACDIKTPLGQCAAFIGDIARPFAIIIVALSVACAILWIVLAKMDLAAATPFVGTILGGLATLYAAKAAENWGQAREAAKVEVAKAPAVQP